MNDFPKFDPKDVIVYVGVDLSSVSDLTAVNYLIIKDNIYYMDTRYYLP
jgi:phage terminase large subunit-like protein